MNLSNRKIYIATLYFIFIYIIINLVYFHVQGTNVSFSGFFAIRAEHVGIVIFDMLLICLYSYYLFNLRNNANTISNLQKESDQNKINKEKDETIIKKYIDNLINGKLENQDIQSDNSIIKSLNNFKESLVENKEEEAKRKIFDDEYNWKTEGLAKFGELLRKDNEKLEELTFELIKNLTKYIEANQGGVFLLNKDEETPFYELIACYAYDRKKFCDNRIELNEGLIGACGFEKATIYLVDIPDQYVSITSGLGEATANALILVPLLLNDEIFGVIEIASFKEIEKYKIEFLEKVAENIASTIASLKINQNTEKLLEQTKKQSEELASQEEELRQNLEEMQTVRDNLTEKDKQSQIQLEE